MRLVPKKARAATESVAVEHNNELTKGFVIYDTEQGDYFAGGGRYPNKVYSIHSAVKYTTPEEAQEVIDDFTKRMSNERNTIPEGKWVVKPYSATEDVEDVPVADAPVDDSSVDAPVESAPTVPAKMTGAERYARDRNDMAALFAQNKGKPQYFPEEIYALYPIKTNDGIRQGVKVAAMADYKATGDKASYHVHEFLDLVERIRSTKDTEDAWYRFVKLFKRVTNERALASLFVDVVKTWCSGFRNKAAIARKFLDDGNPMYINGKEYKDTQGKYVVELWTRWREITPQTVDKLFYKVMKKYDEVEERINQTRSGSPAGKKLERAYTDLNEVRMDLQSIGYALRGQLKTLFVKLAQSLSETNVPDYATAAPMFIRYVKVFVPAS